MELHAGYNTNLFLSLLVFQVLGARRNDDVKLHRDPRGSSGACPRASRSISTLPLARRTPMIAATAATRLPSAATIRLPQTGLVTGLSRCSNAVTWCLVASRPVRRILKPNLRDLRFRGANTV